MYDLSGKTALITGAATGLGQAIAVALAQNGAGGSAGHDPPELGTHYFPFQPVGIDRHSRATGVLRHQRRRDPAGTDTGSGMGAKHGITVNSIAPTFVETDLTRERLKNPDFLKFVLGKIPAGKLALPEHIAAAAVYLASEEASLVSCETHRVDGGWTAW